MDLREYLFRTRTSLKDFSAKLGYSRSYLSILMHGHKKPSLRLAKLIEKATEGKVTIEEQLNLELD